MTPPPDAGGSSGGSGSGDADRVRDALRDRLAREAGGLSPAPVPASAPPPAAPSPAASPGPAARPGEGVTDADELARIIRLLRAAEVADTRQKDIMVGEFTVAGPRVPLGRLDALQTLTRTEGAVLRFLGWGRANADIATLLNINEATVRTHMTNAIRKLDVDGARGLNSLAGLLFHPLD